jgi:hypothetical protein
MNIYNQTVAQESKAFHGTEKRYQHPLGILYTEGVQWLVKTLNCYWLLDQIAVYSKTFQKNEAFMAIYFETPEQSKGSLKITDGNGHSFKVVPIEFTDLYVDTADLKASKNDESIRFFLIHDGGFNQHVLLLPSEY